uniref:non-specific serine/threonine protein kinase n=1 Tax=Oryza punctata TaxID=4537 RepID=A0A0E0LCM3_ORYPU
MGKVSAMDNPHLVHTILLTQSLLLFTCLLLHSNCETITRDDEKAVLLSLERSWGGSVTVNWSSVIYEDQCNWPGINCTDGFVTGISLPSHGLNSLPAAICSLTKLSHIDLCCNSISGSFPTALYNCSNLRYLDLSYNSLVNSLPSNIDRLSPRLVYLNLASNSLSGNIPSSIGQFKVLTKLYLDANQFNGSYPAEIGNISALRVLRLGDNPFLSGPIYPQFGNLTNLEYLSMNRMNIIGKIPDAMSKANNVIFFDLSVNHLSGSFPSWIWSLKRLVTLQLHGNLLSGQINGPIEATNLVEIDISSNNLSGQIPEDIGKLEELTKLFLYNNQFIGSIPDSIALLPKLTNVKLSNNFLSGVLPRELGKHSLLYSLDASVNNFSGALPKGLCSNGALAYISMSDNMLSGELPASLLRCRNLSYVALSNNNFSGTFPDGLTEVQVQDANFSGSSSSNWAPIWFIDLRNNKLSGRLPNTIRWLKSLDSLDLSENKFSGPIPPEIELLNLNFLNLSNNQLSGEIPPLMQKEQFQWSFLSNPELCSSNHFTDYPKCNEQNLKRLLTIFLVLGVISVLLIRFFGILRLKVLSRGQNKNTMPPQSKLTVFQNINFNYRDILSGLTDNNLIGSGSSGKVYKICLHNTTNKFVAAKKISSVHSQSNMLEKHFQAEVEILGSIRHANIVKLLSCMSSTESKVLIYEYMENGSLYQWLHHEDMHRNNEPLNWPRRIAIAIDAARGLCYMHHDCSPPIAHRDVKSSNIILDFEFKAKIADFGLAHVLAKAGEPETMSAMVGTFGYMAPEVGSSRKINEKVDVYGFGVVLLELTTGRCATGGGGGHENLAQWAWRRCQDESFRLIDVIDEDIRDPAYLHEVQLVFKLGLICTGKQPSSRPSMKEVLQVLQR